MRVMMSQKRPIPLPVSTAGSQTGRDRSDTCDRDPISIRLWDRLLFLLCPGKRPVRSRDRLAGAGSLLLHSMSLVVPADRWNPTRMSQPPALETRFKLAFLQDSKGLLPRRQNAVSLAPTKLQCELTIQLLVCPQSAVVTQIDCSAWYGSTTF